MTLTGDIDSRLSELSALERRWQQFDRSVSDVSDWLMTQRDVVSQLQQQTPDLSLTSIHCQVSLRHCYVFVVLKCKKGEGSSVNDWSYRYITVSIPRPRCLPFAHRRSPSSLIGWQLIADWQQQPIRDISSLCMTHQNSKLSYRTRDDISTDNLNLC